MKHIKSFSLLTESINYGILYHIVDFEKLNYIIDNNVISSYKFPFISLTRNKMMNGYLGGSILSIFKLEIDAEKLSNNYKIKSFNYKSNSGSFFQEWEEQVKTHKITDAFKYIKKIILIKSNIEFLKYNMRDEDAISDWFSSNKLNNLPNIIKNIKTKCENIGYPLYVQDKSIIKIDNNYIDSIINHPLYTVKYLYASVLKGQIYIKHDKYGHYEDVIIDDKNNSLHNFFIGKEYKRNEIKFDLNENKNLNPLKEKSINKINFIPYIIKFRLLSNNNLYLENIKPL